MSTTLSAKNQTNLSVKSQLSLKEREHLSRCYQVDLQVKYLHLQAELDVLIQKLQTLKEQKKN